jgi:hypothetical protein
MVRKAHELLFAFALLVGAAHAFAQSGLPPAPVPVVSPAATQAPALAPPSGGPGSTLLPRPGTLGAPPNSVSESSPPILMPPPPPEPLPPPPEPIARWGDQPRYPPPGWFADVEVDVVGPHVKNKLFGDVTFADGFTDTVHVPMAPLDWTGSPRFEIGYLFDNNAGQITLAYRFLASDGHATATDIDFGTVASLRGRLNFNLIDFAYGGGLIAAGPYCDVQWRLGVRLAQAFLDARAEDAFREARTSNHFLGAGPLGAIEWQRRLYVPRLAVYGRLEGAVPLGSIHQSFEEVFHPSRTLNIGAASSQRMTQGPPMLSLDIGLGWTPAWSRFSRVSIGYHLEGWWDLGEVNNSGADLTTQGLFFKGEFSF